MFLFVLSLVVIGCKALPNSNRAREENAYSHETIMVLHLVIGALAIAAVVMMVRMVKTDRDRVEL